MQHLVTSQIRTFSYLLTKLKVLISMDAKQPTLILDEFALPMSTDIAIGVVSVQHEVWQVK